MKSNQWKYICWELAKKQDVHKATDHKVIKSQVFGPFVLYIVSVKLYSTLSHSFSRANGR